MLKFLLIKLNRDLSYNMIEGNIPELIGSFYNLKIL